MISFHVIERNTSPPHSGKNSVFLQIDNWNDYSFVTMFSVYVFDEKGIRHNLSSVKIGFTGQTELTNTYSTILKPFSQLPEGYFSVGVDVDYYVKLRSEFSEIYRVEFLTSIRDVVFNKSILDAAKDQEVFKTSLLRSLSINALEGQFRRVLAGGAVLTDFNFRFTLDYGPKRASYQIPFNIEADSKPSTNIHALIGRNGVGKTTLLNEMIHSAIDGSTDNARFEVKHPWQDFISIDPQYFSSVVSISFSAFDPFNPPEEQLDPSKGTCYFYVGLKSYADQSGAILKSLTELYEEFVESLDICLSEPGKRRRWLTAIHTLESDDNF